jgi:hypothetical protein
MHRLIVILIAIGLLFGILPNSYAQSNTPQITTFTTPVTRIDREELANRTARIPVAWTTQNRPYYANLVFEQMLPGGEVINVELPRIIPWVASNDRGVAAPILPEGSADKVVLRVRLVHLVTGATIDERRIELSIGADGDNDTSDSGRPAITSFTTCCPSARADQLANGSARVPVAWRTINRPPTANLLFEQVRADGSVVNVELPRENPWVASNGDGVAAPVSPGGDGRTIRLRVRLIDLISGRVYDVRELTVQVGEASAQDPLIRYFTTNAASVGATELAQGTARIPVSWAVENRPANTNLIFEQVLPSGAVINVELPRTVPIVPSSGVGVAAPRLPDRSADSIVLQIRLARLDNNQTLVSTRLTLPISGRIGQDADPTEDAPNDAAVLLKSLIATPDPLRAGSPLTITWEGENADSATLHVYAVGDEGIIGQSPITTLTDLPVSGSHTYTLPPGYSKPAITFVLTLNAEQGAVGDSVIVEIMPDTLPLPDIGTLSISPVISDEGGWLQLEAGASVTLALTGGDLSRLSRVDFYLVPTGTGTWEARTLIGSDTTLADGAASTWTVPGQSLSAHLIALATTQDGRVIESELRQVYVEPAGE